MANAKPSLSNVDNADKKQEAPKKKKPPVHEVTRPQDMKADAVDPSERHKVLQEGAPGNPTYKKTQLRPDTIKETR